MGEHWPYLGVVAQFACCPQYEEVPECVWAVVEILVPLGVPNIIRHLILRVSKRDPNFLTTTHVTLLTHTVGFRTKSLLAGMSVRDSLNVLGLGFAFVAVSISEPLSDSTLHLPKVSIRLPSRVHLHPVASSIIPQVAWSRNGQASPHRCVEVQQRFGFET